METESEKLIMRSSVYWAVFVTCKSEIKIFREQKWMETEIIYQEWNNL